MMTELDEINIRHFKLVTGDELIAIVVDSEDIEGIDSDSNALMYTQQPMVLKMIEVDDQVSYVFYDWQPLAKSNICPINPFHVVSHVECSNEVKEQYIRSCINNGVSGSGDDEGDDELTDDYHFSDTTSDRILH